MRISLLQTKQNALYDFGNSAGLFTLEQAQALQSEMVEQTFSLLGEVGESDLIVTTEGLNFAGRPACVQAEYQRLIPTMESPLLSRFAHQARLARSYLVASLYTLREERLYSTAVVYDREGEIIALYDKIHLAGDEQNYLTAGSRYVVIDSDFGCFGVCVCWDMQFPEVCRELALMGARLVVCPTWGWEEIYAHARAYENGIFVAGAMSVPYGMPIEGIRTPSEVVAPSGAVVAAANRERGQVLHAQIDLAETESYYSLRMRDRHPETYRNIFVK